MAEPTPRPWVQNGGDIRDVAGGHLVAYCYLVDYNKTNEANAALIVRAVNSHETLVEALVAMTGMKSHEWACECRACSLARTALAKARGEVP